MILPCALVQVFEQEHIARHSFKKKKLLHRLKIHFFLNFHLVPLDGKDQEAIQVQPFDLTHRASSLIGSSLKKKKIQIMKETYIKAMLKFFILLGIVQGE